MHDCQYAVTGLATNERYEFRVIARNAIGVVSPPSNSSGLIIVRSENGKCPGKVQLRVELSSALLRMEF